MALGCYNIQSDKGPTGDHRYGDLPQTPDRGMTRQYETTSGYGGGGGGGFGGGSKAQWNLLSKELAQKQEMIHRMIKEVDDKTQSLKLTGAEIIDLRRQIKML